MRRSSGLRSKPRWRLNASRSRIIWIAAVSLIAATIAIASTISAFANVARNQNPGLVYRLTGDPTASLLLLQREITAAPDTIGKPVVAARAKESLKRRVLDPVPLQLLGIHSQALDRPQAAARFIRLSENVSRRDLGTQLLLIEQAVKAGDHELALRHYDKALRTSDRARTILLPILSAAIANDTIRQAVVPYVRMRANWMPEFIQFAMRDGADGPRDTAELLILAGAGGQVELMDAAAFTLIGMLVDQGEFALAKQLYGQMPTADSGLFTDASFNAETVSNKVGPLAWTATNKAALGASFEGGDGEGERSARIFANSGEVGVPLRRVLGLQPGRYSLKEARQLVVGDKASQAFWEMKCPTGDDLETIWRGPDDAVAYDVAGATGPVVPQGCDSQILELHVVAGENQRGLEFVIETFDLVRSKS